MCADLFEYEAHNIAEELFDYYLSARCAHFAQREREYYNRVLFVLFLISGAVHCTLSSFVFRHSFYSHFVAQCGVQDSQFCTNLLPFYYYYYFDRARAYTPK